jgi:DNA-binding MarR family transcriptional regulator
MNELDILSKFERSLVIIGKQMHDQQIGLSDYSPVQNYVINCIGLAGSMNVKELAGLMHVTSGAATQQLDALEYAGAITRIINPDNRREVVVSLSPKGLEVNDRIRNAKRRMLQELCSDLSESERKTLVELVEKISRKYLHSDRRGQ